MNKVYIIEILVVLKLPKLPNVIGMVVKLPWKYTFYKVTLLTVQR